MVSVLLRVVFLGERPRRLQAITGVMLVSV